MSTQSWEKALDFCSETQLKFLPRYCSNPTIWLLVTHLWSVCVCVFLSSRDPLTLELLWSSSEGGRERERGEGGHWDKDKECWWGTFIPLALIWFIVGLIFHEQYQRVACSFCYKMHHHWSILGVLWSFMNNVQHQCPRLSGDTSVLFRSVCAACMCVWGWKEQREVQWEQLSWLTHPPHETICYTELADNPIL